VAAIQNYIRVTRSLDVGFPLFACLSLCGAKGVRLRYVGPDGLWYDSQPVNDDVISLPEIAIEYPDADVTALMRPLFNILWNAFGFMRSEMYSEDGKWVAK
jgi:hypothetical protein